jgi:hypothetical protein
MALSLTQKCVGAGSPRDYGRIIELIKEQIKFRSIYITYFGSFDHLQSESQSESWTPEPEIMIISSHMALPQNLFSLSFFLIYFFLFCSY